MNKPQLRFKGFEDEWKAKSLSSPEFCILAGGDVNKNELKIRGKYPVIANALSNEGILGFYDNYYRIKSPAVSITGRGEVGVAVPRRQNFTPVVRLLALTSPNDIDFLSCAINKHPKILESTGVPQLTIPKLQSYNIYFPSHTEQSQIGNYFRQLDEMIAKAEREVNRLEKMKQASLQKMFPRPGAATPEIRFAGFSEPWVIGKLSDLLEIDDNRNSNNLLGREDVLSVSGEFGLVNQIEFQGRSFAGTSLHNYKITHIGQVIYTKSPLKAQPFGIVKSNQYGDGLLSPLYAVYNPINNACADFIHYYFAPVARLNNYLRPLINKGAKNTILISDETALQGEMAYPIDVKEQFYIAQYFRNIDELISAKRQKLAKLRNIKQACLDKMFVNTFEL